MVKVSFVAVSPQQCLLNIKWPHSFTTGKHPRCSFPEDQSRRRLEALQGLETLDSYKLCASEILQCMEGLGHCPSCHSIIGMRCLAGCGGKAELLQSEQKIWETGGDSQSQAKSKWQAALRSLEIGRIWAHYPDLGQTMQFIGKDWKFCRLGMSSRNKCSCRRMIEPA